MSNVAHIDRAVVTEVDTMQFSVDASELGWSPGFWPAEATTDLGNGLPLFRGAYDEDGDFVTYLQRAGCISVRIFND